jgi:hypothetical protein
MRIAQAGLSHQATGELRPRLLRPVYVRATTQLVYLRAMMMEDYEDE